MKELNGYLNGINLDGWFSQCNHSKEHYDSFINEKDFQKIVDWKMDHIRIPFDSILLQNDNLTFKEDGFSRLENVILSAQKYGLNVVLALNSVYGFCNDGYSKDNTLFIDKKCQDNFYSLWNEIITRLRSYGNMLAVDLLNNGSDYRYKDAWNRIANETIKKIRFVSPIVRIMIGGYNNNSIASLKDIDVTVDRYTVYTFHCYEPLVFAQQGSFLINSMEDTFRIKYNSTVKEIIEATRKQIPFKPLEYYFMNDSEKIGPEFFERLMKPAIQIAEEKRVFLYCSEYGVNDNADIADVKMWYKDINNVLHKNIIGHALYAYKSAGFNFQDKHYDKIRNDIIKH